LLKLGVHIRLYISICMPPKISRFLMLFNFFSNFQSDIFSRTYILLHPSPIQKRERMAYHYSYEYDVFSICDENNNKNISYNVLHRKIYFLLFIKA
jgi:hypothetical protein